VNNGHEVTYQVDLKYFIA